MKFLRMLFWKVIYDRIVVGYVNVVICGICLCVGYVVKNTNVISNKYIPLIMLVLGTALAIVSNYQAITLDLLLSGMLSGLASTGLHQVFAKLLNVEVEQTSQD